MTSNLDPGYAQALNASRVNELGRQSRDVQERVRLLAAAYDVCNLDNTLDPPVRRIVMLSGLTNKIFYKHFPSRDDLIMEMISEGTRLLRKYIDRKMVGVEPHSKIGVWIASIMDQARHSGAVDRTRPFVVHHARLMIQFPDAMKESHALLLAPLIDALAAANPTNRANHLAHCVYNLTIGSMQEAILRGKRPSRAEINEIIAFALRGISFAS